MKLMVVGGGGREHAIIKKLKENPAVTEIYALPGNGGIAADATCVPIGAKDIPAIVDFAVEKGARTLWALEKNTRAIAFYARHGFAPTGERQYEEGTTEELIRLSLSRDTERNG